MKIIILLISLLVNYVASAPAADDATSSGSSFKLNFGEDVQDVTINEDDNTEIYHTSHSDSASIIKDFNRRLEVIAPDAGDKCFVRPLRTSKNVEPSKMKESLAQDIEQGVTPQYEKDSEEHMSIDNVPIKDTSCFGETINNACAGREMYWMEAVQHGNSEIMKRDCSWWLYCEYTYLGGGWWWRECWYIYLC